MQKKGLTIRLATKPVYVILSGFLCSAILTLVMNLWKADLRYLFVGSTSGDAALELTAIQNMIESGTRNLTQRLGGITGQQLYDYPVSDALNYGLMRVFSLFTHNAAMISNLFFLATFPLASMSAMLALLELRISRIASLFSSLLYPFMAYHFLRNQNHLLLSAYYMVPLAILVVLWLLQGEIQFTFSRRKTFGENISENRKYLMSAIICLMIASTGMYYAYFTGFFLMITTLKLLFAEKRWSKTVTVSLSFVFILIIGVLLNLIPTFIYILSGQERATAIIRYRVEAQYYSLKLIDLFMPTMGHHIAFVDNLVTKFHASEPLANENMLVSLGVLAGFGFALLLVTPLLSLKSNSEKTKLIKNTSFLVYAGFILATMGGLSAIIGTFFFSNIRCYNRICVFFFFMGLLAVAVLVDAIAFGKERPADSIGSISGTEKSQDMRKFSNLCLKHRKKLLVLLLPLLLLALYDQIPNSSVFPYEANKQYDQEIAAYFSSVEASVPEGTYVYQLPYVEFPEPQITYSTGPYAQLVGYLNTKTIRWSSGAMKGTSSDLWAQSVSSMSAEDMLAALKKAGYGGIYIDLFNYSDISLTELKDKLILLTGSTPIVSSDGQKVFIKL